ncbi:WSC-domain-containing protein [Thozetella sp. PMI_491]|nr:WSC-domain-containing protein [Thozetella sp. PMI_491]
MRYANSYTVDSASSLCWTVRLTLKQDPAQSGYLPNHNIDPTQLGNWTIGWQSTYNTNEIFYAKPLVYTPNGATSELVITVSNQNIVRVVNGMTGALVNSRTLIAPFSSVDTGGCGDIPNTVGITGTPIIDPATDIMYFFAKGYMNGQPGPQGTLLGEYRVYAVKIPSLVDVAGFPLTLSGLNAANDATRYLVPGTVLQRPGLTMLGNTIVAGFGGHCDNFNYSGMLVAVSKTAGVGVTNIQAMEASPGAPSPQPTVITSQQGGKAGIWQSGMALATDLVNQRVFFSTGNGVGPGQNGGANGLPASGKTYVSTLEQSAVNFGVSASGVLIQKDYFSPANYDSLNGGDRDMGSSAVSLLSSVPFSGGGVNRVAITGSKAGTVYMMDADNLGGFKMGAGGTDAILQTLTYSSTFYNGVGSYPLEGGYVYICPTSSVMYAYKLTFDSSGRPQLILAGQTAASFACSGTPTVTSLNGQVNTGVVWMADVNQGLVAFNAVPVGGVLQPIKLPSTGRLMKFHRPVFGNNRAYVTRNNVVIAFNHFQLFHLCRFNHFYFDYFSHFNHFDFFHFCHFNHFYFDYFSHFDFFYFYFYFLHFHRCYQDLVNGARTFGAAKFIYDPMTLESCAQNCTGYNYFGTEYGRECYCGWTLDPKLRATESQCNAACSGNASEICGTGARLSTYQNSIFYPPSSAPAHIPSVGGYNWLSCYTEATNSRALLGLASASNGMTVEQCVASCGGYAYAGLEYGRECYCGNSFQAGSIPAPITDCSFLCAGNSSEYCGGSSRLDVYYNPSLATLSSSVTVVVISTSSSSLSLSLSSSASSSSPSSVSATTTSSSQATPLTSSSTATATTSYSYIGCFKDIQVGHALPLLFANNSVTPELCIAYAQSLARAPTPTVLPYVYVEYHRECYGGSIWSFGSSGVTSLTGIHACTDICSGSVGAATTGTAKCGGAGQFNLYASNGVVSFPSLPTTSSV